MTVKFCIPGIVTLDFSTMEKAKLFRKGCINAYNRPCNEIFDDIKDPIQLRGARFGDMVRFFCDKQGLSSDCLKYIELWEEKDVQ